MSQPQTYSASYAPPPPASADPELPACLNRRDPANASLNDPPKPYVLAVQRLKTEEAALVWGHLSPHLPAAFAPSPGAVHPKQKLFEALRAGATQPDMVLSLIRETAPPAVEAIESLVGAPIRHVAERASGLRPAKAEREPGTATPTPTGARSQTKREDDDHVITLLVASNPKKPGTQAHIHFAVYRDGMTVADALAAGLTRGDLKWDVAHAFIKLEDPK